MKKQLVVCAASLAVIVMGATFLATPARAAAALDPCPNRVAQELMSIAEKTCKRAGKEALITWMNCTGDPSGGGTADFAYECV